MDLLKRFEAYLEKTDRSSSALFYGSDLHKFAQWFERRHGSFDPTAITPLDLVEYRGYLQANGGKRTTAYPEGQLAAPATVNRALVSLSRFCQWLSEQGIIVANPVEGIKPIQLTLLAPHWLTRLQQAALMRAVQASQNPRDLAIVGLMLHAGLRVSEVCQLRRKDLVLRVRSGQVTVRHGKGNKHRIVPFNITIRRILTNYLATLSLEPDFLFASRFRQTATGELCQSHLSSRGVQHLVKRYAERARLDRVSPHTLRHSFCKNLIDAGVSLDKVALLAGHSSLDVTRRYTTPSIDDLQEAVEHLAWE